jgi:L-aspartate oxidase
LAPTYDYIIVGSGIAGLYTALLSQQFGKVLLLTKGSINECNTRFAQGGIAAAIGKGDTPEIHFRDTIAAGDGLSDETMVRILVKEAPQRIKELIDFGVPFDTIDGKIALTLEAAHSQPRIIHAGGDATGEHIESTLSGRVRATGINVIENCIATEILVNNSQIAGIKTINCINGEKCTFECRKLVIATGGAGQLFEVTTNSTVATGDGVALAYIAGAEISDMEFFQFHPTALRLPNVRPFLISEAVRGEGGFLRNSLGRRFMPDYHPKAELAPRDIVARGILAEMEKTGEDKVYLDLIHLEPEIVSTRFPRIYRFCLEKGINITRQLIPVAPAAHYMIGGIRVNSWGETSIKGFYAAGEVASTGVHGANRLASNSLLEVVVFARRLVESMTSQVKTTSVLPSKDIEYHTMSTHESNTKSLSLVELKKLMWRTVGITRVGSSLKQTITKLRRCPFNLTLETYQQSYELRNLIITARLVAEAAFLRQESRGVHYRMDFPTSREEWLKHIIFKSN